MTTVIKLAEHDTIAVAMRPLQAGTDVAVSEANVTLWSDIPQGHKFALVHIPKGEAVIKNGHAIATATEAIRAGDWVHEHNTELPSVVDTVATVAGLNRALSSDRHGQEVKQDYYLGYKRKSGRSGTRNVVLVVSTVNCSATVTQAIVRQIRQSGIAEQFPSLDAIVPVTHSVGCGMGKADVQRLQHTLRGYITHPNVVGVLLVGLGCEMTGIDVILDNYQPSAVLRKLNIQKAGGTGATIRKGIELVREIAAEVGTLHRENCPVADLMLALQCGGSDGLSGITANPALGKASDLLVECGGTSILAETPEIYGAESLLLGRAVSGHVKDALRAKIAWWEEYVRLRGGEINNNPAPGNKAGGLTNIVEKSLGAVAKGGMSPLSGVLDYAQKPQCPGFYFMDSPGYDPCSCTGQIAAGATLIGFTTGRGSAFGSAIVPCLKLSTNSELYEAMPEDIDINCGDIAQGITSIEAKGEQIYQAMIAVASGKQTWSEVWGYGDEEFVPWCTGAVM